MLLYKTLTNWRHFLAQICNVRLPLLGHSFLLQIAFSARQYPSADRMYIVLCQKEGVAFRIAGVSEFGRIVLR